MSQRSESGDHSGLLRPVLQFTQSTLTPYVPAFSLLFSRGKINSNSFRTWRSSGFFQKRLECVLTPLGRRLTIPYHHPRATSIIESFTTGCSNLKEYSYRCILSNGFRGASCVGRRRPITLHSSLEGRSRRCEPSNAFICCITHA